MSDDEREESEAPSTEDEEATDEGETTEEEETTVAASTDEETTEDADGSDEDTGDDSADEESAAEDADEERAGEGEGATESSDASDEDEKSPAQKIGEAFAPIDDRLHWIDWWPIVKKEFADTIRSRALVTYSVILFAIFVAPAALILYGGLGGGSQVYSQRLFVGGVELVAITTSLAGIAFGYASISGERDSGTIKVLLAQPYDRRDVLFGKLFGRFASVIVPLLAMVLLRLVIVIPSGVQPSVVVLPTVQRNQIVFGILGNSFLVQYVIFLLMTMALAFVYVAFGIGVSAGTRSTRRSLAVAGGVWAYLFLFWGSVARGMPAFLSDPLGLDAAAQAKLQLTLMILHPARAFQTLLYSFSGVSELAARVHMVGSLLLTPGRATLRRGQIAQQLGQDVPLYLSDGAAIAVLLLWVVVPMYIGYVSFRRADL